MKKYLLSLLLTFPLMATVIEFDDKVNAEDIEALRTWVKERRQQVRVKSTGGQLTIAGDVRSEYQCKTQKLDGVRQYGPGGAVLGTATNQFDVDVNFQIDYRTDRTWTQWRVRFDNNMGIGSGTLNRIALVRAFLGGRLVNGDDYTINLEVGRKPFGLIFDSRIEFGSLMDGVLLSYDHGLDFFGDVYIHGGPFVIDERQNHFGYVGEVGALNLFETGLYLKYSLINWRTRKYYVGNTNVTDRATNNSYKFLNSQLVAGYRIRPSWFDNSIIFYSGWLWNHAAPKILYYDNKRQNFGCYVGFQMGQAKSKADWSFEVNYQYVQAQAVAPADFSGIGTGNAAGNNFFAATTAANAIGNENYQGVEVNFLYMLTDNITVFQSYQQSTRLNKNLGKPNFYRLYELEFVYAY